MTSFHFRSTTEVSSGEKQTGQQYDDLGVGHGFTYVTVHEKTSYKSEIAILDNAYLKVQTLCYFILKSNLSNRDKITSV